MRIPHPSAAVVALATLTLGSLTLGACGDSTGPAASSRVGLGFQLARTSSAASVMSADGSTDAVTPPTVATTAAGLTITRDNDVLVITKAQLVVKDVKLETATAACTDDDDAPLIVLGASVGITDRSKRGDVDDDGCPEIHIGPFLVDVPVDGTDGARVTVPVPAGTYNRVRLSIHKVTSSDSADLAFRQTFPDFRDISVRLEGTFNGEPFVFVNDVNAKLDVPLEAPVTIKDGGDDVTVSIDIGRWFVRAQGGLYSPAAANTPGNTRAFVQNNIRSSLRAFRDHNRDGHED